ncbi:MAG: DUF2203 family protein [Acidobacteria bacterium]|nr:DUF2203 family protein [Acidobacteriota bacterium]
MAKNFTVDEANKTLPLVRRIVTDIVATHRSLVERLDQLRSLESEGRPGSRRRQLEKEIEELAETANRFIAELDAIGALFKGFEEGLVDFYSTLDGRPVFLCWKLGEESIEWWHELDAGYVGRRPLPAHLLNA